MPDHHLDHLTRREFLRMAGLTAAGAGLAACGVNPLNLVSSRKSSGPVQLVYQDWRTEWFPPLAQEMLAKFNADHPNIHVFYTHDPDNIETREMQRSCRGHCLGCVFRLLQFFPLLGPGRLPA